MMEDITDIFRSDASELAQGILVDAKGFSSKALTDEAQELLGDADKEAHKTPSRKTVIAGEKASSPIFFILLRL
jgi:hypothetical protein